MRKIPQEAAGSFFPKVIRRTAINWLYVRIHATYLAAVAEIQRTSLIPLKVCCHFRSAQAIRDLVEAYVDSNKTNSAAIAVDTAVGDQRAKASALVLAAVVKGLTSSAEELAAKHKAKRGAKPAAVDLGHLMGRAGEMGHSVATPAMQKVRDYQLQVQSSPWKRFFGIIALHPHLCAARLCQLRVVNTDDERLADIMYVFRASHIWVVRLPMPVIRSDYSTAKSCSDRLLVFFSRSVSAPPADCSRCRSGLIFLQS